MNHIALQLDREVIKGTEDSERSGGEAIIFNISVPRGMNIQRTRLIEGQLLFEEIWYPPTNQPTFGFPFSTRIHSQVEFRPVC